MNLTDLRTSRGLSLRGLALLVGVSPTFLKLVESGKNRPSISNAVAICRSLNLNSEETTALFQTWTQHLRDELDKWNQAQENL